MKFLRYSFKVKHDNGTVNISTVARSKESAINIICTNENCPENALTFIKSEKL